MSDPEVFTDKGAGGFMMTFIAGGAELALSTVAVAPWIPELFCVALGIFGKWGQAYLGNFLENRIG